MQTISLDKFGWTRNDYFRYHPTDPSIVFCQVATELHQWECTNGMRNMQREGTINNNANNSGIYTWNTSQAFPAGWLCQNSNDQVYFTTLGGTSGAAPSGEPVHTSGTVSDGGVLWTFTSNKYVECTDFDKAIVLWDQYPALSNVLAGNPKVPPSSWPTNLTTTVSTGYYLPIGTTSNICKMRYWDAEYQIFREEKMWASWHQDAAGNGFASNGGVQTKDQSLNVWNMQGYGANGNVSQFYFNNFDDAGIDRSVWLASLVIGSNMEIRLGDINNPGGVYNYIINSINQSVSVTTLFVTENTLLPQSSSASYSPGTLISMKIIYPCQSVQKLLDYPGYPTINAQTDGCNIPTLIRSLDNNDFSLATTLWMDLCQTIPEPVIGWYNNNVIKRYWNGFVLSTTSSCVSNSHEIRIDYNSGLPSCTRPLQTVYQAVQYGATFSFYHPVFLDAALSSPALTGFYSDGSIWREYDTNAYWNGNFNSCQQNYGHEVHHRPASQWKFICQAPKKIIYQTINVLTLGNNAYIPYTDPSLQTVHSPQWFACCYQGVSQAQFTAHYWKGTSWGNQYKCLQQAPGNGHGFSLKALPLSDGGSGAGASFESWNTSALNISYYKEAMCGTNYNRQQTIQVFQKTTDWDLTSGIKREGDGREKETEYNATVETTSFDWRKPLYGTAEFTSSAQTGMYALADENTQVITFAAWHGGEVKYNPQNVLGTSHTRCVANRKGREGCVLEGTMINLADGNKIEVEKLQLNSYVSTKSSDDILKSDNALQLEAFSTTEEITWEDGMELVLSISMYRVDNLYEISFNEILTVFKTSWDHWNLLKRDGTWYFKRSAELLPGDLLPHNETFVTIKDIDIKFGNFNTYKVDVTGSNLYIADGILTHNAEKPVRRFAERGE